MPTGFPTGKSTPNLPTHYLRETANLPAPEEKLEVNGPNYNGYHYVSHANVSMRSDIINIFVEKLKSSGVADFRCQNFVKDFSDGTCLR